MEVRLQKYFTDCGVMSRRDAEEEIAAGNVKVNGITAVTGQKIDPQKDTVVYRGRVIEPKYDEKKIYLMLNKPRGYVTTTSDEKGRRCVTDLTAELGVRVYPVGRLDMDSDGLLLLTNDGEIANFMTHPRHGIPKTYRVRVRGSVDPKTIEAIGEPIEINGVKTMPAKVKAVVRDEDSTVLEVVLYEGKNRQIRRMCAERGVEIIKLTRISIGEIRLEDLAPGKYRPLSRAQISYLKDAARRFNAESNKKQVKKQGERK